MQSGSLLEQLDELLARVSKVDLSVSEETHRIPQVSEVAPAVLELLDAAVSLLAQAQRHYESEAALGSEPGDEGGADGLGRDQPPGPRRPRHPGSAC